MYLKTLRQIPKSTELQMVIAAPSDGAEDNGDPENSRSSSSNEATPDASPSPSQSKANTSTEGKRHHCCVLGSESSFIELFVSTKVAKQNKFMLTRIRLPAKIPWRKYNLLLISARYC